MSPLTPIFVDSKEISRLISISPRSLERLRSDGTIPFYKIGRRMVRYRLEDVKAALEKTKFFHRPYARMRKALKRDCMELQDSTKPSMEDVVGPVRDPRGRGGANTALVRHKVKRADLVMRTIFE